ncbi:MAG: hypothetical protein MR902_04540 [Campylobacter sp.]|nr:hypothetical protein [Campylobacter sp.]
MKPFFLKLNELSTLNITEANKDSYNCVVVEWQDMDEAKIKSIKVGSGDALYKMQIAPPKSEAEAYKMGEAKLNALQKGGISGHLRTTGREFRAGGVLKIEGFDESFEIKRVIHTLNGSGYFIEVEFEG